MASSALKTGIVGLPNVGKSTLFNAIVKNGAAQAANFPFCTIEPNTGICTVPDERLAVLAEIANTKLDNIVPTTVEFVDIAGLVKGASEGEGLGNQFLANIRECKSIVQARPRKLPSDVLSYRSACAIGASPAPSADDQAGLVLAGRSVL